jgi:hypothetical protein
VIKNNHPDSANFDLMAFCRQIFDSYGTYRLSKKQYAEVTNQSLSSVDKKIRLGRGIARYQKDGNGKVFFPIQEVAKFLLSGMTEVY